MAKRKGQVGTFAKSAPHATAEEIFQRDAVSFLRSSLPGAVVAHPANERTASKALGLVPGYPDLMVHWRGGFTFGIELKTGRNRLRKAQGATRSALADNGIAVIVLRSGDRKALEGIADWARETVEFRRKNPTRPFSLFARLPGDEPSAKPGFDRLIDDG